MLHTTWCVNEAGLYAFSAKLTLWLNYTSVVAAGANAADTTTRQINVQLEAGSTSLFRFKNNTCSVNNS
jgi:hypothetical protein